MRQQLLPFQERRQPVGLAEAASSSQPLESTALLILSRHGLHREFNPF
ncbi:hypothetical protein ACRAWD_05670 [Caulobacter segnis]